MINLRNQKPYRLKNICGASIVTALEFYDFTLYGVFAVIFSSLFFPANDMATFCSLFIYALGSVFRPLGGLVFGYLSDTRGRKYSLILSAFIMAIATLSIGLLPTYKDVGVWSIVLLVLLRCVQGFSAGGEFNNTTIYALESNIHNPGLYSGIVVASATVGTLIAVTLSGLLLKNTNALDSWRIPFILGGVIGFIGCYYRSYLAESPFFVINETKPSLLQSISYLLSQHKLSLFKTMLIGGYASALGFTIFNYVNIYLNSIVGFDTSNSILLSIVGISGFIFLTPLFGHLADLLSPKKLMLFSSLITFFIAYFVFVLLSGGKIIHIIIAQCILSVLSSSASGSAHLYLITLFPKQLRCIGTSLGFTTGIALFGGTMPLISNALIKYTCNPLSPSFYLVFCSVMTLLVLYSDMRR